MQSYCNLAFKLVYFKYGCFSASKDPSFWWLIYSQLPHYSDRSLLQKKQGGGKRVSQRASGR